MSEKRIPPSTAWSRKNAEKHREQSRNWARAHRDQDAERGRDWRRHNKEIIRIAYHMGVTVTEARRLIAMQARIDKVRRDTLVIERVGRRLSPRGKVYQSPGKSGYLPAAAEPPPRDTDEPAT